MATRSIRELVQQVQRGEPIVREDGTIETGAEAIQHAEEEEAEAGQPRRRMQVKKTTFGSVLRPARAEHRVEESVLRQFSVLAAMFPGVETGALGIGPDPFTLSELIPAGPSADRSPGSFGLDPDFLNPLLEKARQRGRCLNCVWHVHPEGCHEPSMIDRQAARELLNDPATGLDGQLLLPISARTKAGVTTRFFVAEGRDARIRMTSPAVIARGTTPACTLPGNQAWGVAFLDALLDARCDRRLADDIAGLQAAGFNAERRGDRDACRFIRAERKGTALWFAVPKEFPASPPRVFAEDGGSLQEVSTHEMPSLVGWSSISDLVMLAVEAEASTVAASAPESLILHPKPIELVRCISMRSVRLVH